jgi:hypothetical protein
LTLRRVIPAKHPWMSEHFEEDGAINPNAPAVMPEVEED